MNPLLFLIGQLITLLLTIGLLGSLFTALRTGMSQIRLSRKQQLKAGRLTLFSLLLWILISIVIGQKAKYGIWDPTVTLLLLFIIPSASFTLILSFNFFRQVVAVTPPKWIIKVQGIRIVINLLFWMGYMGLYAPPQFTFLWFNYDIVVGISALMGSYVFFARGQFRRVESLIWNVFGLFALIYLVGIMLVSLPDSAYQLFATKPDGAFLMHPMFMPLISFILPFCAAMHCYGIWQALRRPVRRTFRLNK